VTGGEILPLSQKSDFNPIFDSSPDKGSLDGFAILPPALRATPLVNAGGKIGYFGKGLLVILYIFY
jgi:hypothetical protein